MDLKSRKKSEPGESGRSLKKNMAVAAVAASLGLSLGVPVGDALAQDEKVQSPPGYTAGDKTNVSSGKVKSGIESKQGKFKPNQGKVEATGSAPIKTNTR